MKIRDFGVEMWMNAYENDCRWNLAETCVHSMTVGELLALSGKGEEVLRELSDTRLTYGEIEGSLRLRRGIAGLYRAMGPENITVTNGAIGANALTMLTLVEPGDRVISVLPTYQQHYSIPESIGARVDILRLREENGWLPDPDELRRLVREAGIGADDQHHHPHYPHRIGDGGGAAPGDCGDRPGGRGLAPLRRGVPGPDPPGGPLRPLGGGPL